MRPRIAVTNQLDGAGIEVLLRIAHRLLKRGRRRLVENSQPTARPLVDLDPTEAGVLVHAPGAQRPDLARLQRVGADAVRAGQLRRDDELLDTLFAQEVAEVGVAELRRADALLLLLHTAAQLQGEAYRPLEVLVGDPRLRGGIEQLQEAARGLVGGVDVAPVEGAAQVDPALDLR